jgi:hypothetical protein
MQTPCDYDPPQKAAMFLKPARADERLRLGMPGHACCLASQFPVTRAPAPRLPCKVGLYGASCARQSTLFSSRPATGDDAENLEA